jgi:6,7-dimethyl-8-ribityllumazine synthase
VTAFLVAESRQRPANRPFMSLHSPTDLRLSGAAFRFAVVAARFNQDLVDGLLARLESTWQAAGVKPTKVEIVRVPGSHEVPWAVGRLAAQRRFDCIVALGVLIGGDTNHHEMVGQSVSGALQQVALTTGIPVINGVIVTDTLAQARVRCTGRINRGAEFAQGALEMARLKRRLEGKS